MDKKIRRYYVLFLTLQLFLPLCTGLGYLFHRPFVLTMPWLELLLLSAAVIVLTIRLQKAEPSRWLILLLPLSIVNGFVLLFQGILGGVCAGTCLVCGWLMIHHAPKGFLRGSCYFLCFLLTLLFALILPFWGFAQVVTTSRTIYKECSPEKGYTAIVRSIDQGALGGSTLVEVRNNRKTVNILVGKFVCSTELWRGHWGDHEGMTLSWEDETTLEIDGISYQVSGEDVSLIADISHTLGAEISQGQVLEHWDDHGGFHGDGSTFVKIQAAVQIPALKFWHSLPAPENIAKALSFCKDENGLREIPEAENGYWFFLDRHSESMDPASYAAIHQRSSWNFTLAVYDTDTEMLYYFEFDT